MINVKKNYIKMHFFGDWLRFWSSILCILMNLGYKKCSSSSLLTLNFVVLCKNKNKKIPATISNTNWWLTTICREICTNKTQNKHILNMLLRNVYNLFHFEWAFGHVLNLDQVKSLFFGPDFGLNDVFVQKTMKYIPKILLEIFNYHL